MSNTERQIVQVQTHSNPQEGLGVVGGHEVEQENEFEKNKRQMILMTSLAGKVNVFSDDEGDEFQVVREDGSVQGIFKTWAVPVIPFLEEGNGDLLAEHVNFSTGDFEDGMNPELVKTLEDWSDQVRESPAKLWQTLERWRGFCDTHDRRLFEIFSERELPQDKPERIAELYWRLKVAFGYSSPFYHLEAMVGGSGGTQYNPIDIANGDTAGGGTLDVVGISLPSALRTKVIASEFDWNGLSWEMIASMTENGCEDEELKLAIRIARKIGVDMEDVLFAANALEWIPSSVGGKKDDLDQDDAQQLTEKSLKSRGETTNASIARDMNALIRFLNWFPQVRSERNFTHGEGWRYAAVCDTANLLLDEVRSGGVFLEKFDEVFREKLSEQVSQLDATSAKGRFLMQLIGEGKLKDEYAEAIAEKMTPFVEDVSRELVRKSAEDAVVSIDEAHSRYLVGGKAAGLREAMMIFGKDMVVDGSVVTSEFIENWLKEDEELWKMIKLLDKESDLNTKLVIAKDIASRIRTREFPHEVMQRASGNLDTISVVRSSSFDEDTMMNGSAAGVYESVVSSGNGHLCEAASSVVASFFSDKAVGYRALHGLSDRPMFALVVNPHIEGHGGAGFSSKEKPGEWEIVVGATPSDIVGDGKNGFDSFKLRDGKLCSHVNVGWIETDVVMSVGEMIQKAEDVLGEKVDMEFVVDGKGEIKILQLRSLGADGKETRIETENTQMTCIYLNSLDDMADLEVSRGQRISLSVGPDIDLGQFQGDLFRWMVKKRGVLGEVILAERVPRTCHLANICGNLGIELNFKD